MDEQRLFTVLKEINETLKKMSDRLDEMDARFARAENDLMNSDEVKRMKQG
jgi:uncharacterized protein YdcH (DUF465 family)